MMKKVLSLGFAGLLLLGASSQALASFENGHVILAISDTTIQKEVGIDLGVLDLSQTNKTYDFNVDLTGYSADSLVGVFANLSTYGDTNTYRALFGVSMDSGVTVNSKANYGKNFLGGSTAAMNTVTNYYSSIDNSDGAATGIANISTKLDVNNISYVNTLQAYKYTSINASGGGSQVSLDGTGSQIVDVYLYDVYVATGNKLALNNAGAYVAHLVLDLDFDSTTNKLTLDSVSLNPSAVPVPGAALLFGSALLGLAGVRRRQFQG